MIMSGSDLGRLDEKIQRRLTKVGHFCAAIALAASQATADEGQIASAPPETAALTEKSSGSADGVKALVCDELGFLSIFGGIDEELRVRQFSGATVQHADGLIVVTNTQEIHGITTLQSGYFIRASARTWTYAGFRGTEPIADRCTDITTELADSFVALALAASWGMPEVERRVDLFEALEDDLRTRLELAELEREALQIEAAALREEISGLETELVTTRMAFCEIANQTQGLLTWTSFDGDTAAPAAFIDLLAEATTLSECLEDTVVVTSTGPDP